MSDLVTPDPADRERPVSRRRVVQGAAAAAGAVWVAPLVDSFASRAAASSGPTLQEEAICDSAGQDLTSISPGTASGTITISVNFTQLLLGYAGSISGLSQGDQVTELDIDSGGMTIISIAAPQLDGMLHTVPITSGEASELSSFCSSPSLYSVVVKSTNQPNGVAAAENVVGATNCCQGYQGGIPNRCYAPATKAWCEFWYGGPFSTGSITGGPCTIKPSGRGCCAGTANCT
jgi:hypothetical protein